VTLNLRRAPDRYDREDQSAFRADLEREDKRNLKRDDFYASGVFTPTIAFNGASVGVTYTTQLGAWTKIGNRIFYEVVIVLSSKGSSNGTATVRGFPPAYPFPAEPAHYPVITTERINIDVAGGYYACFGEGISASHMTLREHGDNVAAANLTDADFSNTSAVYITGQYRID
jgi:hypothetical protein